MANRFTVAFWEKAPIGLQANQWVAFVSKRGDDGIGYQVRRYGGNNAEASTLRQTALHGYEDVQGTTGLVYDGNWHHVAAVYDGYAGTRQLYVDGVLEPTINLTGDFGPFALAPNHHLIFGSQDNNSVTAPAVGSNGYLGGEMYDVRIYNYPLTMLQIQGVMTPPAKPSLTVVRTGPSTLQISWPSSAAGYVPYTSTSVSGGVWTAAGLPITTVGSQSYITVTIGAGPQFYRLYLP
jgi:hypothetical protein